MSGSPLIRRAAIAAATTLAASVGVAAAAASSAGAATSSTVYTLSNAPGGSAVLAFRDTGQGPLTAIGPFPTGGNGNGSGLGSQGAVTLDEHDHYLAAVNAGSNSVSLFDVHNDGRLKLLDTADSQGVTPISATIDHNRLFVLNAGAGPTAANIAGFRIEGHHLHLVTQSVSPLSAGASGPAEIAFTPNGHQLVVTEKGSSTIDTFAVEGNGAVGAPVAQPSAGSTPFGFGFSRKGQAIVS